MTTALRAIALAIVVLAAVDPAVPVRREAPGAVDVRLGRGGSPVAAAVHTYLATETAGRSSGGQPDAIVIVDPGSSDVEALPDGVPVSVVFPADAQDRAIEIVRLDHPAVVLPGQAVVVRAEVRVRGLAGADVQVTVEQAGLVLAETTRQVGAADDRFAIEMPYTAPAAGLSRVRVAVQDAAGRHRAVADTGVRAEARPLRVLVFEPRPSWGVTFIRQALERDPVFELSSLGRTSRGVVTRTAAAPGRLTPATLQRFDAILVGAPEALTEAELQALDAFARERGGAVVFQPDTRPSGPYARRLAATFDEVLVERPASLRTAAGELRASEMAIARAWLPGVTPLATRAAGDVEQAVITSWPMGEGRLVFSGALDGWRYRADEGGAFERFWPSLLASLAAAAPRPLELTVDPAVAAPGDPVRVIARLRPAGPGRGLPPIGAALVLPSIAAALVREDGARHFVRLWPAAEDGVFEGRLDAPAAGRHVVQVSAGSATADVPLLVADAVRQPRGLDREALGRVAGATGGVAVYEANLAPLFAHLRDRQVMQDATVYPLRSAWWFLAGIGALCAEWALRRRRGLR
jgi:hypothetical protein